LKPFRKFSTNFLNSNGVSALNDEKLHQELEKIIEYFIVSNEKIPVIVEGINDVKALRNLELTGRIISFNCGLSMVNFSEMIAKEYGIVILLPDWDHKGIKIMKEWRKQFRATDVKIVDDIWIKLFKITKKEITCVEELDRLVFRLRENAIKCDRRMPNH